MSLSDLGLSSGDRTLLLENVNIVFLVASTVRFNEILNVAVSVNTKGTARIMELYKELKHVITPYVSTAYSNVNILEIEEIVYR